jgi:hypothetical protein
MITLKINGEDHPLIGAEISVEAADDPGGDTLRIQLAEIRSRSHRPGECRTGSDQAEPNSGAQSTRWALVACITQAAGSLPRSGCD